MEGVNGKRVSDQAVQAAIGACATIHEAAGKVGLNPSSMYERAKRLGLTSRTGKGRRGLPRVWSQRVPDNELLAAYSQVGSVWKTAATLGLCGQSVHERLSRLGALNRVNWSDEERQFLAAHYEEYAADNRIAELAALMERPLPSVYSVASAMGLGRRGRPRKDVAVWKYVDEVQGALIWADFKKSSLGLGSYCKKKGYDDLGFSRRMKELFPDEYEMVIELKAPKQGKYRYGRQFEYRVKADLSKHGFYAMRSPASKSPVDLMGLKPGCQVMVQCKRGGQLGVQEWNELFDLATSVGALPILASTPTGRGILYQRLIGRKDGSRRAQPFETWSPSNQEPLL